MNQSNFLPKNFQSEKYEILNSPYLRRENIEIRDYQITIAINCIGKNYLVIIPTGLGKTIISAIVAAKTFEIFPDNNKVIILAPTKPLITQHAKSYRNLLKFPTDIVNNFSLITGSINPDNRKEIFESGKILFYTPQTLRNDIVQQRYSLKNVCLLVFDEAHRASGDYAYCEIAKMYKEMNPDGLSLALTASPGSNKEKIETLYRNLNIPFKNRAIRSRNDKDVKPFLQEMKIIKVGVDMNQLMQTILLNLRNILHEKFSILSFFGILDLKKEKYSSLTQKKILALNKEILAEIKIKSSSNKNLYSALSICAECMRIFHMISLVETQGLNILLKYIENLKKEVLKKKPSKALINLTNKHRINDKLNAIISAQPKNFDLLIHPK
ncbi:MAG: DEAD/DEAH box helicase family protein [archaeon]|nr:DEAD/DEAH box helicase family protein [archaeon]